MEYLKIMAVSTKDHLIKMLTDGVFYVGGTILGVLCYLTGLTPQELSSVFILILLDIGSRVWAEKANNRPVLSKKMYQGFVGKVMAYAILFIAVNQAFYIGEYLKYIILSGFSLIEIRSIYENLKDAKQKHLDLIGAKIEQEVEKFRESSSETIKESNDNPKI